MIGPISSGSSWSSQNADSAGALQRHNGVFARIDANGDGAIDMSELEATARKNEKGREAGRGANDAGLMNMVQSKLATDGAVAMMSEIDVNKDGVIDQTENDRFMSNFEQGRPPMGPPPGIPPSADTREGNGKSFRETAGKIYDVLDTNRDGNITMSELLAAFKETGDSTEIEALIKRIDENGDKSVSRNEFSLFLRNLEQQAAGKQRHVEMYDNRSRAIVSAGGSVDAIM